MIGAQIVSLLLTAVVMWVLHSAEHGGLVVIGIGAGVYVVALGAMLTIAKLRAESHDRRVRDNFDADLADRNRHRHPQ